jgi:hypothetical protein
MKGEIAPAVANHVCPHCNRRKTACMASRKTRVNWWCRSPEDAKVPPKGNKLASSKGKTHASGSNWATRWRPSSKPGACQKAATLRGTSRLTRESKRHFQAITTQEPTDRTNNNTAKTTLTTSLCSQKSFKLMVCFGAGASAQVQHVKHVKQAALLA